MAKAKNELEAGPTKYTILLQNNSLYTQDFFFFQEPAQYTGGAQVYSNSIYSQSLRGQGSGAQLFFELQVQYYAGVQTQPLPPVLGQPSGTTTVIKESNLTPASGPAVDNKFDMLLNPLGLDGPFDDAGVQKGAFRITSPAFNPLTEHYNAGLGVKSNTAGNVLSNFVNVEPQKNIDVQPIVIFYVQTGAHQAGTVVNFTTSSVGAAKCDTTKGITDFTVTYEADGSWLVNGAPSMGMTQAMHLKRTRW